MVDRVSFRASFLEPSKHGGEEPPHQKPTPTRARLQVRRTPAASGAGADASSRAPGEHVGAQNFVFATPGGPSSGQKAARSSKKKSAHRGHTPGTPWTSPLQGSPMQWSPLDSQASDQLGGASAGAAAPASAESRWGHPGSNANIANVAAPAAADPVAVELMTRLHLSGSENLPQELQSRLNISQQQQQPQPAAKEPAPSAAAAEKGAATSQQPTPRTSPETAAAAAAEVTSRLRHVHVTPAEDLPQQFARQATVASSASPAAEAARAQAEFVFMAGAPCSPAQRQPSKSPATGRNKQQGAGKVARRASAVSPEARRDGHQAAAAAVPPAGQAPTAAPFVFGASSVPRSPAQQETAQGQQASPRGSQDGGGSVAHPASASATQQQQAASAPQPVIFGQAPMAPPAVPSFIFGSRPVDPAPTAAPSFVFGHTAAAGPGDASGSGQSMTGHSVAEQSGQQQAVPGAGKVSLASRRFRRKSASASPSQSSHGGSGHGGFATPNLPGAALFGQPGAGNPGKQPVAAPDLAQELAAVSASEAYRSQGNEAFKNLEYESALDLYTKAIKALWPWPNLHPRLALLLSNRAAALLSLGRPFQALKDCQMGLKYDPKFTRCALRITTCHYRLGNFAAAEQHLRDMKHCAAGDRILLNEIASKLEEMHAHQDRVLAALSTLGHSVPGRAGSTASRSSSARGQGAEQGVLEAGLAELEALWAHVPHAEYLHAAKAQALLRLGRFAQAVEACNSLVHYDEAPKAPSQEPWQLWLEAQCTYHDGNYLSAVTLFKRLQQRRQRDAAAPAPFGEGTAAAPQQQQQQGGDGSSLLAAVIPLPTAEQLAEVIQAAEAAQRLRQVGNELMKFHKYAEAVQKYTEALATPGLSAAFASILHSNRAAAHQGQSQWVQAVADCCRSKALAPSYAKAHSRLAALLTELRLHDAAARALESALQAPNLPAADRRDYEARLREARHAAQRKAGPRLMGSGGGSRQPDHYKLLMLDRSCSVEEVRKAYKRLALQLHPDKSVSACRYSAQLTEAGALVLPVAAAHQRLQDDAKWLFQCLGEAHEVLSDRSRRQELDQDLSMEERFSGADAYGGFGFGERHYGPGSRYGSGYPGYSPSRTGSGADFAERFRRAAQYRPQANSRAGFYGYGWAGF